MKSPLLNLLTALSLLLCLTASALWARSYFVADALSHQSGNLTSAFFSHGGTCVLYRATYRVDHGHAWRLDSEPFHSTAASSLRALRRLEWTTATHSGQTAAFYLALPHWTIAAPFALLPAARLARRLRRHPAPNTCPTCGYDLRATPGQCPECGNRMQNAE